MHGRAIRIFLVDGTPTGMRTVEVGLSTIKAVIAPRTALDALKLRDESSRTGVYILIGDDVDIPGRLSIYVGEGDSVLSRIQSHDANKDFWHTVALFVSKDANLTKSHGRWVEARLVEQGRAARRAKILNATEPNGGHLPESDESEMNEFINQVRMILGSVGFDVFAPETQARTAASPAAAAVEVQPFVLSGDEYSATLNVQGELLVVSKGSTARKNEIPTLQPTYKTLRATLLSSGVLVDDGAHLKFAQDYGFRSPSQASAVVSGSTINGRTAWKQPDGTTYEAWEARSEETPESGNAAPSHA